MIRNTTRLLRDALDKISVINEVHGRLKEPYSILKKMKRKKIHVSELNDLIAFRVIVQNEDDCYKTLDLLKYDFPDLELKYIKDYVGEPKENGYQSIHVIVKFPNSYRNAEIQIRTREMHEIAERGRAAHLEYKKAQDVELEKVLDASNSNIFHIANKIRNNFSWLEEEIIKYEQEIMQIWNNKKREILGPDHENNSEELIFNRAD